eukprot:CAMPEP_0174696686 /NCGR_PEP_ID=MMETSP1094-20130205/2772_1 /TAXON_ID=156173 /ORGANISM="Chrysochromulina brevifilum, Strain UTEX LB 985" /LENGTH=132 /DNA_ID=CAMNT_0015893513 /DNA_START=39 /DNA_END=434 /DNA_ORIENTATION=-
MLPEVDTISLVTKQPSLLRRDVDGALRPRLHYMSSLLGAEEANRVIVSNPRLLMSSWGVLGRLRFVQKRVAGGFEAVSPSTAIMTPKAAFEQRFRGYRAWLQAELEEGEEEDVASLERCYGTRLESEITAVM